MGACFFVCMHELSLYIIILLPLMIPLAIPYCYIFSSQPFFNRDVAPLEASHANTYCYEDMLLQKQVQLIIFKFDLMILVT